MRNESMKTNLLRSFLINQEDRSGAYKIKGIGATNHVDDYNYLLDQPDYEDHLVRLIVSNRNTQHQAYILRDRMVSILELINSELNRN
jgi:hypothetical protein